MRPSEDTVTVAVLVSTRIHLMGVSSAQADESLLQIVQE